MIDLGFLASQRIVILGLGRSGMAAAEALSAGGGQPIAWDDNPERRDAAAEQGITVRAVTAADLAASDMLILSPGIPRNHPAPHPVVEMALEARCPVMNDIDLLAMAQPKAGYIGITGTNGKSTTTALIGHILKTAGLTVEVGGNLGTPALALNPLEAGCWYVLELSSYQLETVSLVPWQIGVFLNVTPDHLDRYSSMADYVAAKRRLFQYRPDGAVAVVGADDPSSRELLGILAAVGPDHHKVVPISGSSAVLAGVFAADGVLTDARDGAPATIVDLKGIPSLPGVHNHQNAAAAYAACRAAGAPPAPCCDGLQTFPGLHHRQQLVAERSGVRFVNDSKATNPDAAARALASYDRIYWIAGGRAKEGGLDALAPHLSRVAHAFLIGEATELFAAFLDGRTPYDRCGDMKTALAAAYRMAGADAGREPVVLLSPACASFDQFRDFEERGDSFIAAVESLAPTASGTVREAC